MGYIFVTREVVNVCGYCVSDSFVFVGYIFVTRELGAEIIEAGLQMSYNLCNLPKQITAANGTSVKYSYFADGTKFKAVNAAGNGFAYTGSLRWSVQNGVLTPESVAITGGRALYNDVDEPWSVNYYITDHLGSVRAVTDAEGEVLDTYDYMPYGSEISSTSSATTDYRFTCKEKQLMFGNSNIYDSFARFQNTYGRFMSIDPKAESFYHISPYTYCAGDPVNLVDPDGKMIGVRVGTEVYFWRQLNNKWGFYNGDDVKYSGSDKFIKKVEKAFRKIMRSKHAGQNLIKTLSECPSDYIYINKYNAEQSERLRIDARTYFWGNEISWDIDNPEKVPTTAGYKATAYINLAHELAHARYKIEKKKSLVWFTIPDAHGNSKKVYTSEIYTTHIENMIRSELYLPLRTHYEILPEGSDLTSAIINPETGRSLYFINEWDSNNTELPSNVLGYAYY